MISAICFLIAFICGLFGVHRLFLMGIYLYAAHKEKRKSPSGNDFSKRPRVTVQLPIYNERYVVERLIDSVCNIRYPRRLLDIQVLDDSDDETRGFIDKIVYEKRRLGHPIQILRRPSRTGFKAGALQNGLSFAKGDWVLIFDSDFVPKPDLLEKAFPYLSGPKLGMIQFCWDHINRNFSLLTRVQALFLDGHFRIEHFARNRSGRFFNFNGTAGMWRKSCIVDSGGWQYDTLTEDLDLSYRAQMKGWKFLYIPEIRVPAELPIELSAFKSQQFRWAKGGIQTARKILPSLFRSDQPPAVKIEGTFHMLSNMMYLVLPCMILLMPLLFGYRYRLPIYLYKAVLLFSLFSVCIFYLVAAWETSRKSFFRIIGEIPLLMAVGIALCINNSRAVLEGFCSDSAVFVRTPKYNVAVKQDPWKGNVYRIKRLPLFWTEVFFLSYLTLTLLYCIHISAFHMTPYLFLFTMGFLYFVTLSLRQIFLR